MSQIKTYLHNQTYCQSSNDTLIQGLDISMEKLKVLDSLSELTESQWNLVLMALGESANKNRPNPQMTHDLKRLHEVFLFSMLYFVSTPKPPVEKVLEAETSES